MRFNLGALALTAVLVSGCFGGEAPRCEKFSAEEKLSDPCCQPDAYSCTKVGSDADVTVPAMDVPYEEGAVEVNYRPTYLVQKKNKSGSDVSALESFEKDVLFREVELSWTEADGTERSRTCYSALAKKMKRIHQPESPTTSDRSLLFYLEQKVDSATLLTAVNRAEFPEVYITEKAGTLNCARLDIEQTVLSEDVYGFAQINRDTGGTKTNFIGLVISKGGDLSILADGGFTQVWASGVTSALVNKNPRYAGDILALFVGADMDIMELRADGALLPTYQIAGTLRGYANKRYPGLVFSTLK